MRTSKIKNFFRILDTLSSVLSILALLLIYRILAEKKDFRGNDKIEWKNAQNQLKVTSSLANAPVEDTVNGKLAVQVWPHICGGKLENLIKSPLFPRFSEYYYSISETRAQLNQTNYGQRVIGYLHPKETGYYKFVLYSDDGSEFWFGANESLESLKLAASVASRDIIGSAPVGEIRYESQITEDFLLEKGKKYPLEIIHLQGTEADFVELRWIRPGKHYLEPITMEFISHSRSLHSTSKAVSLRATETKSMVTMATRFFLVAFLTKSIVERILPVCGYALPVLDKPDIPHFHALREVKETTVIANDKGKNWKEIEGAQRVIGLFMAKLEKIYPKRYTVVKLYNLEHIPTNDTSGSALYLMELELGCNELDYTEKVVEYVYLHHKREENSEGKLSQLCYPRGLAWNKEAMIHLIVAVNREGQRFHRFIEKLETIYKDSLEVDFRLVVVHSNKSGVDIERILQGTVLQKYVVHKLDGEFSRARAINHGVKLIQDPLHIILTADVHMDLPPSVFEDCRKHCIEGKMIYAPIFYALDCGAYPDKPKGSWRSHDYQMIGMYKRDWERIGGLDEHVTDDEAAWDLVGRILPNGLHVARVKSPNLFRLFLPMTHDSQNSASARNRDFLKEDV